MSSLVLGCNGLLSGSRQRHRRSAGGAVAGGGGPRPRRGAGAAERIYPVVQAFYAPPFLDMHNRMKEALVLLGRLKRAVVRPPLVKLPASEIARLQAALAQARITAAGAFDRAA